MARPIETGIDVADVYAAALFALAQEADALDDVRAELEELVKLAEQEPDFARFLAADSVDDDARRDSLEKLFRGRLSDIVLNTLHVMNDHGRAGLLRALLRAFVLRLEDARGQVEVTATSAVALTDDERSAVEGLAEHLSGKKPLVEYETDESLIGGLVIQIGDYRFDYSIRWQLAAAREQLLERGHRGLEIGTQE